MSSIIKPRTARVVIYQGDDLARLTDLDNEVKQAQLAKTIAERKFKDWTASTRTADETLPEDADSFAASERYEEKVAERDAFAAEAEDRGVVVGLKSLPRREWRRLRNAHPPREDNPEDEALDCNVDSMPDEAVPMSVDRESSTIEGDVDEFLDSLTAHDFYNRIFLTVLALNVGGDGADPKLRVGSVSNPTSPATSN